MKITRWLPLLLTACLVPSASGEGDLGLTKIVLQLEPANAPRSCTPSGRFSCDDNLGTPSNLNVNGSPNTSYLLYLIAVDINTSVGLKSVTLELDHDPGINLTDWQTCADVETNLGEWTFGLALSLTFNSCVGTVADPNDPEGDGAVVLGSMYVYSSSFSRLWIGAPSLDEVPPVVVDCKGDSITLQRTGPDNLVALGEVGFGETVVPGCEFDGVTDNLCEFGSHWMYGCCMSDSSCGPEQSWVSERACKFAGGSWRLVRCAYPCENNLCRTVPVIPLTWGRLKSRY